MRISKQRHTRRRKEKSGVTLRTKVRYVNPSQDRMDELKAEIERKAKSRREHRANTAQRISLYQDGMARAVEKGIKSQGHSKFYPQTKEAKRRLSRMKL